jgi:positive regulator of sigma E activity
MIKEIGNIVETHDGQATIQIIAGGQCNYCSAKTACTPLGTNIRMMQAPVKNGFQAGDYVEISFEPLSRMTSVIIVFLLPLFLMITGLTLAAIYYQDSEKMAILGSFGGLLLGFVVVWILDKLIGKSSRFDPILKKIDPVDYIWNREAQG